MHSLRVTQTVRKSNDTYVLIQHFHGRELIDINEVGINLWTTRACGRAVMGTRAVHEVQGRRGRPCVISPHSRTKPIGRKSWMVHGLTARSSYSNGPTLTGSASTLSASPCYL
ncbi:hypothetical protein ElyMa_006508800 [Elysia marginata]|uniref:Uncharacterized protein n=1 Tax=Elysia marginata TaxID=1093978 RepID=A0AAV4I424_9GAST|nr:hypothetical protein ElyMa_006508800 [Elysia marginata]